MLCPTECEWTNEACLFDHWGFLWHNDSTIWLKVLVCGVYRLSIEPQGRLIICWTTWARANHGQMHQDASSALSCHPFLRSFEMHALWGWTGNSSQRRRPPGHDGHRFRKFSRPSAVWRLILSIWCRWNDRAVPSSAGHTRFKETAGGFEEACDPWGTPRLSNPYSISGAGMMPMCTTWTTYPQPKDQDYPQIQCSDLKLFGKVSGELCRVDLRPVLPSQLCKCFLHDGAGAGFAHDQRRQPKGFDNGPEQERSGCRKSRWAIGRSRQNHPLLVGKGLSVGEWRLGVQSRSPPKVGITQKSARHLQGPFCTTW